MNLRATVLCLAMVLVIDCCGCGRGSDNTAHLVGKVTLNGKPIPADAQASITFQPAPGNKAKPVAAPIVNGAYDSPNTPQGAVTALFSINVPTGKMVMSERLGMEVPEIETITLSAEQAAGIPLDIENDESNHDFALKSEK